MKRLNKESKLSCLWHYDVHKKLGESLLYIQLTFLPTYKREEIFEQIRGFFQKKKISSYCIYEIYGYYDLLLRIWIPERQLLMCPKELHDRLKHLYCTRAIPFYVEENPLHWAWWDKEKDKILFPSKKDINNLSKDTIRTIEQGTQDELERLEVTHIIRIIKESSSKKGIKFFVVIPQPYLSEIPDKESKDRLISRLKKGLENFQGIVEPSIYVGSGFAWILVKGKILFQEYARLNNLVQDILVAGVEDFMIRTYTYLVTDSAHPYSIEQEILNLPQSTVEKKHNIDDYLQHEEDDQFEVKGSLSFNVDRYLRDKTYKGDFRDEKIAIEGVVRSIVGLLNAEGGEILIGVLEEKRYGDVLKDPGNPLSQLPRVGERIVFGINCESEDWDKFSRRLTDLIRAHIGRDASAIINKIEKHHYKGQDLCLVKVPKGAGWYYLDEKQFWVRRAGSTILLEGQEMDRYKNLYYREVGKKR